MTSAVPDMSWRQGSWFPLNFATLSQWLKGPHPADAVATFDFDNTSIVGDVGEVVFEHQLKHTAVRLDPQALESLLTPIALSFDSRRWLTLTLETWNSLWPLPAASRLETAAYPLWRHALSQLYQELTRDDQPPTVLAAGYSLLARLWSGFRPTEVEQWTQRALLDAHRQHDTTATSATIGVEPHMRSLMAALRGANIVPHIVSASFEPLVAAAAVHFLLPVERRHIFGLRTRLGPDGSLTTESAPNYPITYRRGKVDAINQYIGVAPSLVAGDAMTDFEMLVGWPETQIRLIINRNSRGTPLATLCDHARLSARLASQQGASVVSAEFGTTTLLQGRHPQSQMFAPTQETETSPALPR